MELPKCPFCKQAPVTQNHNIYVKCSTKACPIHSVDFLLDEWRMLNPAAMPPSGFPAEIMNVGTRERHIRECMEIVTKCSVRDPSPGAEKFSFVVPTRLVLQELEKAITANDR